MTYSECAAVDLMFTNIFNKNEAASSGSTDAKVWFGRQLPPALYALFLKIQRYTCTQCCANEIDEQLDKELYETELQLIQWAMHEVLVSTNVMRLPCAEQMLPCSLTPSHPPTHLWPLPGQESLPTPPPRAFRAHSESQCALLRLRVCIQRAPGDVLIQMCANGILLHSCTHGLPSVSAPPRLPHALRGLMTARALGV